MAACPKIHIQEEPQAKAAHRQLLTQLLGAASLQSLLRNIAVKLKSYDDGVFAGYHMSGRFMCPLGSSKLEQETLGTLVWHVV